MLRSLRNSLATFALLAACAGAAASLPSLAHGAPPSSLAGLSRGTRTVLVSDVPSAENLLFLSDGRLLVSGDKGVYQLTREGSGAMRARSLVSSSSCSFGAIAEARQTVYVNCYDFSRAFIYAAPLASLAFEQIFEVTNTSMGNGLATDGDRLYLTATMQTKVVTLTIDPRDPRVLGGQVNFVSGSDAPMPNGIEVFGGALYWSDLMALKTTPLGGKAVPRTLATRFTVYDDLHVDERGIIVCDFAGNALVAYDPSGKQVAETRAVFRSPSAVVPARGRLGFGPDDLIVTERAAGVVSVYRPE